MLLVATRAADPTYTMVAHRAVGAVSFHTGRLTTAEQSLELALKLYDKDRHASLATVYGSDHAETCACFLSLTKWVRGAASDAIQLQDWAVRHAASLHHAHSLAQAYAYRSFLYCLVGDPDHVRADAREALSVAATNNLRLMRVFAECLLAAADATQTVSVDNTAALQTAIDGLDAAAPKALRPYLLTIVADAYRQLRRFDDALAAVDEADAIIRQTTERWAAAEVWRVRGAILGDTGLSELAERAFRMAIQVARAQSANKWAARALHDLTALLSHEGRAAELPTFARHG
jgi:tetratricopeptide (TPR) repeat protein